MNTLGHEEAYRGKKLLEKIAQKHIFMCGAGAIGSNLVDNLVRQGFDKVSIIDFDRIEDHNRHTQIWTKRDLGQLKAAVLKNTMFNVRGVSIAAETKKLEESNIKKVITKDMLVIDGFDNVPSRALVTKHCRENKIDCLHVGLYKASAEVCWNEEYRVPDEVKGMDVCEYPLARNIVLMAVSVASEVIVRYVDRGVKESYFITLGDFKIVPR